MSTTTNYDELCPKCGQYTLFTQRDNRTGECSIGCSNCDYGYSAFMVRDDHGTIVHDQQSFPSDEVTVAAKLISDMDAAPIWQHTMKEWVDLVHQLHPEEDPVDLLFEVLNQHDMDVTAELKSKSCGRYFHVGIYHGDKQIFFVGDDIVSIDGNNIVLKKARWNIQEKRS